MNNSEREEAVQRWEIPVCKCGALSTGDRTMGGPGHGFSHMVEVVPLSLLSSALEAIQNHQRATRQTAQQSLTADAAQRFKDGLSRELWETAGEIRSKLEKDTTDG